MYFEVEEWREKFCDMIKLKVDWYESLKIESF